MGPAEVSRADQTAAPVTDEQRAAPRVTLLIRPAKLVTTEGEFVGVIRDVSAHGVSVRLFHALPSGDSATLETETGQRIAMQRIWLRDHEAGFEFAEPIDISALVHEKGAYPKRKLRLDIAMPVTVAVLGVESEAELRNISQQGARVFSTKKFALQQVVRLGGGELPEVRAKVRWRRAEEYGLVFEDTFSLGEFAELAAMLQAPELVDRPTAAQAGKRTPH